MTLRGRQHRLRAGRREARVLQSRRHRRRPSGPCGRSDLGCLRTDVTADEGVCLTMEPCSQDADCPNPVRSTCAATFLNELYAKIPDPTPADLYWHSDHLYCLQRDCVKGGSSCGPGQSCLPLLVTAAAHPPDICVPNCDAQDRCPPNHFCFSKLSGSGSPPHLPAGPARVPVRVRHRLHGRQVHQRRRTGRRAAPEPVHASPAATTTTARSFDSDQGKFVCQLDGSGQSLRDARRLPRRALLRRRRLHARRGDELRVLEQADARRPTRGRAAASAPAARDRARRAAASATSACRSRSRATERRSPAATPATSASPAPPTTTASA